MSDLPGSLRLASTFPFVGRAAELERLRTLMPSAEGEGRRVVLLGGEPGSGKSRLVREFAREAAGEGALVLYGACDVVVRTPYGPFVEALDQLARTVDPAELRTSIGTGGGELTRLLPDLAARIGELPLPVRADPDTERHRLHTAVTDLLAGVTRERPALFVLEDGHWADAATLLLLRHLTRAAGHARVLLLVTFRDSEADVPEELSETLADLRRSDDIVRLRLAGLSGEEVAEFVRSAAGGELGAELRELAAAIHGLTKGNPFLVSELWRAFVETGTVELGTPESVREIVSQRLSRLSPATSDLLELAATAGSEFELELVQGAAGLPEPQLLAALDEAVRSGMLEELPSPGLAYRFTHELVRRALYDRLSAIRRAELHLRVADALEGLPDGRGGRSPTSRTTSPRRRPSAAPGGRSNTTCWPHRRPPRRSPTTRRRRGCEPRSSSGSTARPSVPRSSSSSARRATEAARRATRSRPSGPRRRSRASSTTRASSRARRSASRTRAGARGWRTRAPSSCSRKLLGRSETRARSCASGCSAASPARSTSRVTTSGERSSVRTPSRWREASAIAPGSRRC